MRLSHGLTILLCAGCIACGPKLGADAAATQLAGQRPSVRAELALGRAGGRVLARCDDLTLGTPVVRNPHGAGHTFSMLPGACVAGLAEADYLAECTVWSDRRAFLRNEDPRRIPCATLNVDPFEGTTVAEEGAIVGFTFANDATTPAECEAWTTAANATEGGIERAPIQLRRVPVDLDVVEIRDGEGDTKIVGFEYGHRALPTECSGSESFLMRAGRSSGSAIFGRRNDEWFVREITWDHMQLFGGPVTSAATPPPRPAPPRPAEPPPPPPPPRHPVAVQLAQLAPFAMGETIEHARSACERVGGEFEHSERAIYACRLEVGGRPLRADVILTPGTDRIGRMNRSIQGPTPEALSPVFLSVVAQLTALYGTPSISRVEPDSCNDVDLTAIARCLRSGVRRLELIWRRGDPGASHRAAGDQARLRAATLEDVVVRLGPSTESDDYYIVVGLQADGYAASWGL